MAFKGKKRESAQPRPSPHRFPRWAGLVSVLALILVAIYLTFHFRRSAIPDLPSATWQEADDGSQRAVVDQEALLTFCQGVGLEHTPDFRDLDPVLTAEVFDLFQRVADRPEDASLYVELGNLYQRHDFAAAARAAYQRALALEERYETHYLLARVEFTEGRIDRSIQHLQRTIELNPEYTPAYYHLAEQLMQSGQLDEAEQAYQHLATAKHQATGYLGLALVAQARNAMEEAQRFLEKALTLDPDNYRVHYQLALLYQRLGQVDLYAKHFGAYQRLPHRITLEDPLLTSLMLTSVTPPLVREVVDDLNLQGRASEALALLSEAIEDRPRSPILLRQLALTHSRLKQEQQALSAIEASLDINEEDVVALAIKGRICLAFGRYTEAMEAASRAVELDPSRAENHFLLGQAYRAQERPAEAIASYRAASDLDPDNFLLAVAWAESLFSQGRYDEAEAAFQRADRARAGDPRVQHRLEQIEALRSAAEPVPEATRNATAPPP